MMWYALYRLGLYSGLWQRLTPALPNPSLTIPIQPIFPIPGKTQLNQILTSPQQDALIKEADEIVSGEVRLFGGPPVPLQLAPGSALRHWTAYERGQAHWEAEDVKFTWEPARFGWAFTLGRAYLLSGSQVYPEAFWQFFEAFTVGNPPNLGPNWCSAQEVALRLVALVFAGQVMAGSSHSTPARLAQLTGAISAHARRILPTLSYARAQHNNHLVTESLGLVIAGSALPSCPEATGWRSLGWKTLCHALQAQISPGGVYAQHSMNYHRLMLQAALIGLLPGTPYPAKVQQRLAAAARWLLSQVDPVSGQAPNYGSNDGAYIFPMNPGGYLDYRPTAQAAARAFLGQPVLPRGAWDEMSLWLGLEQPAPGAALPLPEQPFIRRARHSTTWAVLRANHYTSRPSQADQLHVDLWFQGVNIALDAGTFRYSAAPPWDNALGRTAVHNTVTVDGQDQMQRAGRFLWLDWAQAQLTQDGESLLARHDGYRKQGILHIRRLTCPGPGVWEIQDRLEPTARHSQDKAHSFRLQWLLPDWPWQLDQTTLSLTAPWGGQVQLSLTCLSPKDSSAQVSLVRAGKTLVGAQEPDPTWGWVSPTYSIRNPALSFAMTVYTPPTAILNSQWILR